MVLKRGIPVLIAIIFGVLTLLGLLVPLPEMTNLLLSWAGFLAAVALILGVLNLFVVHSTRLLRERNLYSGILILSMFAVAVLAITDSAAINLTEDGVNTVFNLIQAPLEAALASLLAFFLLFAGFRLLKRQRNIWSVLFILTAILILISNALINSTLLPPEASLVFGQIRNAIQNIFVTAGIRGILIGIALGIVTFSIRMLTGLEQPYNK
ncbi:MAG TPA: hypothetical protein VF177_03495 [Anaerolineae bacterium]